MILENFSIGEFFGIIFILPLFIWLPLQLFDGIGIFRDVFFATYRTSETKPKKLKKWVLK